MTDRGKGGSNPPPVGYLPLDAPTPGSSFADLIKSLGMTPFQMAPETGGELSLPEGTTVLALRYQAGVVMVGDRRATEGYSVAHTRIQKVFPADGYSAVAVAGAAGLAMEMVRLFQVELEHYEKLEGIRLSLDGKANFLSRMVRGQLPMAFQGLAVVPLFAGFDEAEGVGRLYTFDVIGGRYEEQDYGATGSGSREARSYLRIAFKPDLSFEEALEAGIAALVAAADVDVATGGPDLRRGILPNVVRIDAEGVTEVEHGQVEAAARKAVEAAP